MPMSCEAMRGLTVESNGIALRQTEAIIALVRWDLGEGRKGLHVNTESKEPQLIMPSTRGVHN